MDENGFSGFYDHVLLTFKTRLSELGKDFTSMFDYYHQGDMYSAGDALADMMVLILGKVPDVMTLQDLEGKMSQPCLQDYLITDKWETLPLSYLDGCKTLS